MTRYIVHLYAEIDIGEGLGHYGLSKIEIDYDPIGMNSFVYSKDGHFFEIPTGSIAYIEIVKEEKKK